MSGKSRKSPNPELADVFRHAVKAGYQLPTFTGVAGFHRVRYIVPTPKFSVTGV